MIKTSLILFVLLIAYPALADLNADSTLTVGAVTDDVSDLEFADAQNLKLADPAPAANEIVRELSLPLYEERYWNPYWQRKCRC